MGYEVESVADGNSAWEILRRKDPPRLAILDWMMPGRNGVDVCRDLRDAKTPYYIYVMLLTARTETKDIVTGLHSGADDYLTKPFDPHELRCRLQNGERILRLESELAGKVDELEEALAHVKQLQGLLPICMYCKNIRDKTDTWHRVETYIERHSDAMFTHSLCEDCRRQHYPNPAAAERR